jgi:hypothetical protein
MKYSSLQEYFYKFQNVLYLLILLPLVAFTFLFISKPQQPLGIEELQTNLINNILMIAVVVDWLLAIGLFNSMLRSVRKLASLGLRLERYYIITVIRFSILSVSGLMMVTGFFFTGNILFSVPLGLSMILYFFLWPRSAKVCSDLKLKGDEREMVYYKKMKL